MTETPTDKKLSERFGGFDSAEQQERAVFMDAFDAADSKLFAKGVAAGIAALDKLRALRLYESHPSAGASRNASWQDGRRNGIKWAVEYLHTEARSMNDDHAKMVLNGAAFHMGAAAKTSIKDAPDHPSAIREAVEGEREACAKLVAAHGIAGMPFDVGSWTPGAVAAAIRARGEEKGK